MMVPAADSASDLAGDAPEVKRSHDLVDTYGRQLRDDTSVCTRPSRGSQGARSSARSAGTTKRCSCGGCMRR
jgi:hypothetical protein